jgi:hypothetical protein
VEVLYPWERREVEVTFRLRQGARVPVELRFVPTSREHPRPITASELRRFPLGRFIKTVLADEAEESRWLLRRGVADAARERELAERVALAERSMRGPARGGRTPLSIAELREVADIYSRALSSGRPPTAAVATARHVSHSTAAKQVAKAREKELLPPTTRGRAAGWPVVTTGTDIERQQESEEGARGPHSA